MRFYPHCTEYSSFCFFTTKQCRHFHISPKFQPTYILSHEMTTHVKTRIIHRSFTFSCSQDPFSRFNQNATLIYLTIRGFKSFLHSPQCSFHEQKQLFVSFEQYPLKVTASSQSKHITQTCFLCWSWQPQGLPFMICKKVSGRSFQHICHSVTVLLSSLYIFPSFTEMRLGLTS